jgi:hypothetical protein
MKVELQLPSFDGATGWLNQEHDREPVTKGHPILVRFWPHSSEPATTDLARLLQYAGGTAGF